MKSWMHIVWVGFAAGCTGDEPGKGDPAEQENSEAFAPAEGEWTEGSYVFAEDGCGFGEDLTGGGTFQLSLTDGGFFYSDDAAEVFCALDDRAFTCDPFLVVEDFADSGLDAELTFASNLGGTLSSPTAGTVEGSIEGSCTGADCSVVGDYDGCVSTVSYEVSASP